MAKKINITAQLNAATTEGILADAGQIFDAKKGKFQEQVNEEFEDALEEAITSEDTDMVVESIEEGIIHNALRKTKQILTEAEKGQARENIGAVSEQTFENEAVRVKKQVFTSEQKYQARHNISAITAEEAEKIAQDKINETSVSSPDKLQAVKELSSWLEDNPDSAATMNAAIQDNAADIQRLYRGTGIDEYSQFSTGMDYAIGDVVLYDGVLFRFKADHAKGAWDYNEVEEWSEKKEREEQGQYEDNPEYARAYTDAEGRFLWGIKQDGSIEFAKGMPTPIKNYIVEFVINRIDNVIAPEIETLKEAHEQYLKESESPEWARVIVDAEGKELWGIRKDGSVEFTKGVPSSIKAYIDSLDKNNDEEVERINQLVIGLLADVKVLTDTYHYVSNPEWACAIVDSEERILMGIKADGSYYVPNREFFEVYNDIEGRTEMTLDDDGRVLSYRDKGGIKHETKMSIKDGLSLGIGAMSDLQKALKAGGFNAETPVDWSNENTISLPIPRYCAKVNIISETGLATTKTQDKKCVLEYWDKSGNYFKKYIVLNAQGSSSMAYIEKNQSIDVFNDEACEESCDITFGNWVVQDSFHLKCYYIDVFRGISNVCYNYYEECIQATNSRNTRIVLDNSATTIAQATGNFAVDFGDGALCHPDGFPFEMYVNGEYYGLYVWNLKKHRKNYSMDKKDYTAILLDGVIDEITFFGGNINWKQFELRNPKDLVTMDGKEYDADTNCNELIDATSEVYDNNDKVHKNTAQAKSIVERQAGAIGIIKSENDPASARTLYEQYYDVDAMMCFFIISNVVYHHDGFRKNWIWTIYNNIAAPTFYDLDSVFGRSWEGTQYYSSSITSILGTNTSLPTGQLVRLYKNELDAKYKELRDKGVISVQKIMSYVYDWIKRVGLVEYKKNLEKWPSIPSYRVEQTENDGSYDDGGMFDSPKRIELWLTERIAYLDNYFNF